MSARSLQRKRWRRCYFDYVLGVQVNLALLGGADKSPDSTVWPSIFMTKIFFLFDPDATSGMMRTNEKQRQVSHSELLKDLSAVHEYAKFLRDKLGEDQFGSFVHRLFLSCLHLSLCILMHSLSFLTVKQGRLILLCHNSCSLVPPESD